MDIIYKITAKETLGPEYFPCITVNNIKAQTEKSLLSVYNECPMQMMAEAALNC